MFHYHKKTGEFLVIDRAYNANFKIEEADTISTASFHEIAGFYLHSHSALPFVRFIGEVIFSFQFVLPGQTFLALM